MLSRHPRALVVRTSAFFGAWDEHNFVHHALSAARQNRPFTAVDDLLVSPTYVPDLVDGTLDLLLDGESGIRHLATPGRLSWADFARRLAQTAGLDAGLVDPVEAAAMGTAAERPADAALASAHGALLPGLDDAIARFLRDYPARNGLRADGPGA